MTDPLESLLETFSEHSASYAKEHENSEEYFNLPAALALICREILNLKKKRDKETAEQSQRDDQRPRQEDLLP